MSTNNNSTPSSQKSVRSKASFLAVVVGLSTAFCLGVCVGVFVVREWRETVSSQDNKGWFRSWFGITIQTCKSSWSPSQIVILICQPILANSSTLLSDIQDFKCCCDLLARHIIPDNWIELRHYWYTYTSTSIRASNRTELGEGRLKKGETHGRRKCLEYAMLVLVPDCSYRLSLNHEFILCWLC